jgi:putative transposase
MGTRKNWNEEQIIGILKQVEAGLTVAQVCRDHGVGESTYYKWKSKYGGLEVNEARRLKSLEDENARLKRLLADAMLDNAALKDVLSKNW